jgi:hypothetical protein
MPIIWTFATRNFTVDLSWDYESAPDLSWDETGETAEKIESGEWTNATFHVRVLGPTGDELASDYLGNSIYADVRDFRTEHLGLAAKGRADGCTYGAYFPDMVRQAISEARAALGKLQAVHVRAA